MSGWERSKVFNHVFPNMPENEQDIVADYISNLQDQNLERLGGRLYKGVKEGLEKLNERYRLFIVSNCPANTITQMMRATEIEHLITDSMAHGQNNMPKYYNIDLLIQRHKLTNPIYIGDTDSDRIQSDKAKLPFVFVDYGFGKTESYFLKFNSFTALQSYFLEL